MAWRASKFISVLVLALWVMPAPAKADASNAEVMAFISGMADTAILSLTAEDIERDVRKERFRQMVHDYFAIKSIAKWVLKRHWRRATTEQKNEYLMLFENMLLERYVDAFKNYTGETLEVDRAEKRGERDYIVHTFLKRPGATKPVDVGWRVGVGSRGGEKVFKIVDIFVNGLSMSQVQEKEFNSVIRNNGNSVESLLEKMREMAKPAG